MAKAKLLNESSAAAAASAAASAAAASTSVISGSNLNTCSLFSKIFREINGDEWNEELAAKTLSEPNTDCTSLDATSTLKNSSSIPQKPINDGEGPSQTSHTHLSANANKEHKSNDSSDCCTFLKDQMISETNPMSSSDNFDCSLKDLVNSVQPSIDLNQNEPKNTANDSNSPINSTSGCSSSLSSSNASTSNESQKSQIKNTTQIGSLTNCFGREVTDKVVESAVEAEYAMLATGMYV